MNFYKMKDLIRLLSVSRWTILRMIEAGTFPEPIRVTSKTPRWPANEVDDWMQGRFDARKAA